MLHSICFYLITRVINYHVHLILQSCIFVSFNLRNTGKFPLEIYLTKVLLNYVLIVNTIFLIVNLH